MLVYVHGFLLAVLLNIVIETVLIWLLITKVYRVVEIKIGKIISAGIAANLLTTPYIWFVFPFVLGWTAGIFWGELFVWIGEAIFYKIFLNLSFKKAIVISLIANAASYIIGRFLHI
jgi:hypothetical protein